MHCPDVVDTGGTRDRPALTWRHAYPHARRMSGQHNQGTVTSPPRHGTNNVPTADSTMITARPIHPLNARDRTKKK
jgi:hypothetical protein